jgi:hypothetical protein
MEADEVVLRHFYRHYYKSSTLWFIVGGAKVSHIAAMDEAMWTR